VSFRQPIGCEDRLRNDLYCVAWGVKLYSIQSNPWDSQYHCYYMGPGNDHYTFHHSHAQSQQPRHSGSQELVLTTEAP